LQARWTFSLYPQAAEGGGCFVPPYVAEGARGGQPDPVRSNTEAGRRARATLRRYCAANRLNRFATLTYARSCRDPRQLRADVGGFFRGLRQESALMHRLLDGSAPVVSVCAPVGYGKTTLLTQYATASGRPVAWISLDAADDDATLLLLEIATALDPIVPIDGRVFRLLTAAGLDAPTALGA
jgi:hypothetical protein